jgi:hypothetical protein
MLFGGPRQKLKHGIKWGVQVKSKNGGGMLVTIYGNIFRHYIGATLIYLIKPRLNIHHCSIKRGDKRK